jgi:EAL domain-containing protein (putative c-di-GMP-specific phosphodiesterase class I)
VHLARDLGISMTAEGIETAEHMNAMREAGCNHAQGYLLGRPQPIQIEKNKLQPLRENEAI